MAMVVEDDMTEVSINIVMGDDKAEGAVFSVPFNSVEFKQIGVVPSQEDATWADSCFIKDHELSETNWNSLKDALIKALNSPADTLGSSTAEIYDYSGGSYTENFPTSEETMRSKSLERTADDTVPAEKELENEHLTDETVDILPLRTNFKNAFRPTYKEDAKGIDSSDSDTDSIFPAFVMEPNEDDIFRVWDLDIPAEEEDELVKQLEKALSINTSQPIPSISDDDAGVWEDSRGESPDDLIAGISGMSLSENSH